MGEYEKIRDLAEEEIGRLQKILDEHPEWFSEYGRGYWNGNIEGIQWVLAQMAEIHTKQEAKKK